MDASEEKEENGLKEEMDATDKRKRVLEEQIDAPEEKRERGFVRANGCT